MQPYQQASKAVKKQGELPFKIAGLAATAATTAVAGGAVGARVLPFLSSLIPEDLMIKGLSKIDPRFGKFVNKALKNGGSIEEVRDFIKDKMSGGEEKKKDASQTQNILEEHSPELHEFVKEEIGKGGQAHAIAAQAYKNPAWKEVFSKLHNATGQNLGDIIASIFGENMQPVQGKQQSQLAQDAMSPEGSQPTRTPSAEAQAAQSGGTQALMQALQASLQARQRRQGQ